MLTLGWKASPEQFSPEDLLEFAIAADTAGFDSIDVSDHFHPWSEAGQAGNTWSLLGAVAARAVNIEIGTGVTCPILRYNPVIIAQAAATIERLSTKGFYLGVGTGEALNEYSTTGVWPDYNTRRDMLREAIELIRLLWSGAEVTYDGEYYRTRKARLYSPPKRKIPIYISSMVPESAYFAGYYGDGLITTGSSKEILRNFEKGARDAGKDPDNMPKHTQTHVELTDDVEKAIEPYRKYWRGTHIHAMYLRKIYTPRESEENGHAVGDDTLKKSVTISANPVKHADMVQSIIDAGYNRIYFNSADPDQKQFIRTYAEKVLPVIRDRNRGRPEAAEGTRAEASH